MESGFSTSRLARLDKVMTQRYVDTGLLPGLLTMVYRRGQLAHTGLSGQMDVERGKAMRGDTIFRIYSMSKPITAVALMMLVEEGYLGLDDDVATHIPSWKHLGVYASGMPSLLSSASPLFITTPPARPMKVVDLVTHTSGLTYGFMNRTSVDRAYRRLKVAEFHSETNLDTMIEQLSTLPLEFSPGTAWNYSVSIDVMGYLVQKLSGQSFGEFLRTRLFEPLGMTDRVLVPTGEDRPLRLLLHARRERRPPVAGRCRQEHLCRAAAPRVRRRRVGLDGARLYAILPHDAEQRHIGRRADPEPEDGRAVQRQFSSW